MVCSDQGGLVGSFESEGAENDEVDAEPAVDLGHAQFKDPIVGTEEVLAHANGDFALPATPLKSPQIMTQAEWEKHCATHLPYHPGCPWCVAARRPNVQHRPSHVHERVISLLVAEYCYLKCEDDEPSFPLYPSCPPVSL